MASDKKESPSVSEEEEDVSTIPLESILEPFSPTRLPLSTLPESPTENEPIVQTTEVANESLDFMTALGGPPNPQSSSFDTLLPCSNFGSLQTGSSYDPLHSTVLDDNWFETTEPQTCNQAFSENDDQVIEQGILPKAPGSGDHSSTVFDESKVFDDHTSRGLDRHASRGLDGHASSGLDDHSSRGLDGHASKRAVDHASRGLNGKASRGLNGKSSRGLNSQSSRGLNNQASRGPDDGASRGLDGHASSGLNGRTSIRSDVPTPREFDVHASREFDVHASREIDIHASRGFDVQVSGGSDVQVSSASDAHAPRGFGEHPSKANPNRSRMPTNPRYKTRIACVDCARHKLGCEYVRPCKRCRDSGKAATCTDRPHVRRRQPSSSSSKRRKQD